MLIGERVMRKSGLRVDFLGRPSASGLGRWIQHVLHWGAWLNYTS